jgi:predicted HTH transcriptional regulator
MTKVTIKDQFVEVAEVLRSVDREDLAEFIDGRVAVLDKKAANKKATAKQEENEILKAQILDTLTAEDKAFTVGELIKVFGVSSQKMSALLTQMVKDGAVARTVEKKVAYFKAA